MPRPPSAHHALAALALTGHIRVFVTTNFDRLLEQALADVGITPLVVRNAAEAASSMPFHHAQVVVFKLHGIIWTRVNARHGRRTQCLRPTLLDQERSVTVISSNVPNPEHSPMKPPPYHRQRDVRIKALLVATTSCSGRQHHALTHPAGDRSHRTSLKPRLTGGGGMRGASSRWRLFVSAVVLLAELLPRT